MTEENQIETIPLPTLASIEQPVAQIHRAMLAAKRDMPAIAKSGEMSLGGKVVPFTKIDDIRAALYPILEKYGIMTYPVFVDQDTIVTQAEEPWTQAEKYPAGHELEGKIIGDGGRPIRDGRIPTRNLRVQVVYDVFFVYAGDNSEVRVRVIGEAMDTSADKATGKATTAAIKRAFVETFAIVDRTEVDIESENPDDKNRAATTDRRTAPGDRGTQARQAASGSGAGAAGTRRAAPQRPTAPGAASEAQTAAAETGADTSTGELPEPAAAPAPDRLTIAKHRVRDAVTVLGYSTLEVDTIAAEVTGKATRPDWVVLPTAVEKLATELEARVAAKGAE